MEPGFRRKRNRPMAEMNVVPYIDVMLVLLVIFMVTAPMLTQGLKVDLPVAAADPMALKDHPPVILSLKADGSTWLRVGDGHEEPLKGDALLQRLTAIKADSQDTQVLINGDRHVDYGSVVALMSRLQQAGIHDVGLLTQLEDPHTP
ncbi:MAG: protein TolR [Pseudomonadales bacterium]|nr:protein TolR [Pseudomonadales bacterium]